MHRVTFLPSGLTTRAPDGATILDAANWAGVPIESVCGGRGTCGKCGVKVLSASGAAPVPACRTSIHHDSTVEVPGMASALRSALPGSLRQVVLCPNVHKVPLRWSERPPRDAGSDLGRLTEALRAAGYEARVGISVLQQLPRVYREFAGSATAVVCGDECIAIEAGDTAARNFGLALDIGTTSVAGAIVNLHTGAVEATASLLNRQVRYGADVIARISHAAVHEGGLAELQACVIQTINELAGAALNHSDIRAEEIYECVAVGNATMLHLLLGIDPSGIGVSPFAPAFQDPVTVRAADLGLHLHPEARLSTLPIVGAYVGADIVGGLLATEFLRNRDDKARLFVDVGTNGEIVARRGERCLCAASPAGPAFEGAQIQRGMRASAGAIEQVKIDGDVSLSTIGNQSPAGICGSGLIDAVAELRGCGLLDQSGRFVPPEAARMLVPEAIANRLVARPETTEFLLADAEPRIVLTQRDVRALQYAKAAVAAGTAMLLCLLDARPEDLEEVLLAGAFGSYLNPASARAIGLAPAVALERIRVVGNAAGQGAILALLSRGERDAARQMPKYLEYVELSGNPAFNDLFTESLGFPCLPSAPLPKHI